MSVECKLFGSYSECEIVNQRGSVVRVGDLNMGDPGSNPILGLLNELILSLVIPGANSPRFVNSQLVCLLPVGIHNWERGILIYDTEKPL